MKAKPTKITRLDKLDSFGNTTFVIEFDNGEKGFYTSKSAEQTKFVVGNVADYEIETKQGSKGPYNKITVPKPAFMQGVGKAPVDPRIQMISMACSYSKDLVVAKIIDIKHMHGESESIFKNMLKLYDTIK